MKFNTKNLYTVIAIAFALIFCLNKASGTTDTFFTSGVVEVEFTVSPLGAASPGLPGSAVSNEDAIEAAGGFSGSIDLMGERVEDDIYSASLMFAPGTNGKIYDDGGNYSSGNGTSFGLTLSPASPGPGFDMSIRTGGDGTNIDAYAIPNLNTATHAMPTSASLGTGFAVQFSVASGSGVGSPPGIATPDVASEANSTPESPEQTGDIFEAFGFGGVGTFVTPFAGGGNTLIADESALGLMPTDDLDGFIVNEPSFGVFSVLSLSVDIDGNFAPDMPVVFFSFSPTAAPAGISSGAEICTIGGAPYSATPATDPTVIWTPADLGLVSGDDIDALWVDSSVAFTGPGSPNPLLFSLAPGSPSLTALTASPADIIHVVPGAGSPSTSPSVALLHTDMGLAPTDDVDALWVTRTVLVPVSLSSFTID